MIRRMATVRVAKAAKMKNSAKPPAKLFTLRPMWITMVQSTSDSSGECRETGHPVQFGKRRCGPCHLLHPPSPEVSAAPRLPATLVGPRCTANLAKKLVLSSGHLSPGTQESAPLFPLYLSSTSERAPREGENLIFNLRETHSRA